MNYTQFRDNFQFIGKINIDNKPRFGYQISSEVGLMDVSICRATSEAETPFMIFYKKHQHMRGQT